MTTQGGINVRVRTIGAEQARRALDGVTNSMRRLGGQTRRMFGNLIGLNVLAGLAGGGLLAMTLSTGAASNSMLQLTAAIDDLIFPLRVALDLFANWFAVQSPLVQALIILGGVILWLARGVIIGALLGAFRLILGWIGRLIGGWALLGTRIGLIWLGIVDAVRGAWTQIRGLAAQGARALVSGFRAVGTFIRAFAEDAVGAFTRMIGQLLSRIGGFVGRVSRVLAPFARFFPGLGAALGAAGRVALGAPLLAAQAANRPGPGFASRDDFAASPAGRGFTGAVPVTTPTPRPAPNPANVVIQNYGLTADDTLRQYRRYEDDPGNNFRTQGGF